ncbi:DNA-directed DNA polymerase alpha catalytic subunit pol1 [Podila epigama]|nr:DNA-directed DNA polymerase alpha catalytic subunit pol1 [Podila epigama]
MSSSRSKRRATDKKENALAQLKAVKRGEVTRMEQVQVAEAEDMYDLISTDDRVMKRLRQEHDDFVEDDDGQGYADNSDADDIYSDEDPVERFTGKGSKKNKSKPTSMGLLKPEKSTNIKDAFMRAAESRPKVPKAAPAKSAPSDGAYLASILDGLDDPTELSPPRRTTYTPTKKAVVNTHTPTRAIISKMTAFKIKDEVDDSFPRNLSASLDDFPDNALDDFGTGFDDSDQETYIKQDIIKKPIRNPFQVDDDDDEVANHQPVKEEHVSSVGAPLTAINNTIKQEKATVVKKSEVEDRQSWMTVDSKLNSAAYDSKEPELVMDVQESSIKEEDGTLRMYWIDACEHRGTVYLFGKVLQRTTNSYVSSCITVHDIERNLFLLPRPRRVDKQGNVLEEVDMSSVYTEFDEIRQAYKIPSFLSKPVERKYAFDLPGVPGTAEYLKVVYPYTSPSLPEDLTGETFSHTFGARTSALEHFIIKRNLMGPCWLEIKEAQASSAKISWCKTEFIVRNPKHIVPMPDSAAPPPPPLCVMSISLRTIIDTDDKSNEIVSAATTVYHEVRLDDDAENSKKVVSKEILIRKLKTSPFPPGFDAVVEKFRGRAFKLPSERALLNRLLIRIFNADPDVIVGHNFVGFDLDVLLHRMKHTKADHWSRIGRLRRTTWPKLQSGAGGMGDTTASEKQVMAGRLMCDTYLGAKEHVRSKSYSLTQLVATQLGINREDIEYEKIKQYFSNSEDLERMLRHSDVDTYLCAELMFKLQLLPLSRQLTSLSGNLWSITLTAGRAVRNEYLLLHEFHRNKYICPDKSYSKFNKEPMVMNDGDDQDEAAGLKKGTRKKPQYAGGLVLEPKKGFYDTYILLLDFNSLYPSIIQEYNICFTTVKYDKDADNDTLPEYPDEGLETGILPRLLENLVSRRREVKRLMKNATGAKYAEYDIRQMGLKLTANSMYGCLGAAYSRFYAKQLAMLITSRGREILQNTVDLATENGLDVIYGDTDSIMINSNTTKIEEVKPIAEKFKAAVNARYKLLEIETDGLYKRMLLLKKKKYAALLSVEKNGKQETVIETKGLDMVRRDWCGLSQDVSSYVLTQILSNDNKDREQVVENIHSYLRTVGEETRKGLIPLEKFVVNKGLTKAPEDYADAKSQPHVQVALRMKSKGLSVRAGDTVPYVICVVGDNPPGKSGYADRAYHPDEITQPGSTLTVDFEYYLESQVHPPLDRLCGPIEGTDSSRLADCLGLDTSRFRSTVRTNAEEEEMQTLASQLTDAERFKDAEGLELICRNCKTNYTCTGLLRQQDALPARFGLQCPACNVVAQPASASIMLTNAIRKYIQKYYQGWVVCDDQGCRNRTRMVSVAGRRCLVEGCRGNMHNEYSDGNLYTQLSFFSHIFDAAKAVEKLDYSIEGASTVRSQIEQNRELIRSLKANADKYIDKSARRFVDLSQLFSFVKISGR